MEICVEWITLSLVHHARISVRPEPTQKGRSIRWAGSHPRQKFQHRNPAALGSRMIVDREIRLLGWIAAIVLGGGDIDFCLEL